MSCHYIGRGMNSIVRTVITLMDNREISKEAARTIIISCRKGIGWCDGNTYEATDYISRCLCGRCMKLIPKGEKIYSVWKVSDKVKNSNRLSDDLVSDGLCEECFDHLINQHCKSKTAAEREKKYIEANWDEDKYTSTGEYESTNNGSTWPDISQE